MTVVDAPVTTRVVDLVVVEVVVVVVVGIVVATVSFRRTLPEEAFAAAGRGVSLAASTFVAVVVVVDSEVVGAALASVAAFLVAVCFVVAESAGRGLVPESVGRVFDPFLFFFPSSLLPFVVVAFKDDLLVAVWVIALRVLGCGNSECCCGGTTLASRRTIRGLSSLDATWSDDDKE